jgi:hypothetical protein
MCWSITSQVRIWLSTMCLRAASKFTSVMTHLACLYFSAAGMAARGICWMNNGLQGKPFAGWAQAGQDRHKLQGTSGKENQRQ